MKCIECGHELKDGAIFCIRCGAMQVSMDGKPIERGEDWPVVDAQAGASGFRSSADGALHSAQSRNPRGFQPAPQRNGGKIAAVIIAILAIAAIVIFALTQCMGSAVSGTDTSSAASQATTTTSTTSASATSTTSGSASATSTSASATSASASATSASAAATNSASAESTQQTQQEAQPAQEETPSYSGNDYYVLPSSDSYYYSYDELSDMSTWDLYIARNEIYARHGRMFNRSDLQDYFNSQDWYEPVYTPSQFDSMGDENVLSDVELKNARLMRQVEADKGSPYL